MRRPMAAPVARERVRNRLLVDYRSSQGRSDTASWVRDWIVRSGGPRLPADERPEKRVSAALRRQAAEEERTVAQPYRIAGGLVEFRVAVPRGQDIRVRGMA